MKWNKEVFLLWIEILNHKENYNFVDLFRLKNPKRLDFTSESTPKSVNDPV
jgi:hypothetical protein